MIDKIGEKKENFYSVHFSKVLCCKHKRKDFKNFFDETIQPIWFESSCNSLYIKAKCIRLDTKEKKWMKALPFWEIDFY